MNHSSKRNIFLRALLWLIAGDVRAVLAIACAFFLYMALQAFGVTGWGNSGPSAGDVISLFIFGVFMGVIVVTDGHRKYKKSGLPLRLFCGAITGAAIGQIHGASMEVLFLLAIVGAVLGYFGMRWAQHV